MSPVRFFGTLFLSLGLSLAAAQSPAPGTKPTILFTVKDQPVTTDEFIYLFKKNHPRKEDYTEAKATEYLNLLVVFKSKVAEATARGFDTTRNFRKEITSYKAELKKPYLADKDQVGRLTREAYERMTLELRASHILVGLPSAPLPVDTLAAYSKIIAFRDRVLQGEDFASLARMYSEEPSARSSGGDLGYFTVFQMVYPFESASYGLKTGELSMPVRTRFGYHLIRVTDRRMARGEVEVSHIILRTGTKDDSKVKTKIFELHAEIAGGRKWEEVCKEYSDDASTKNTGGRLRPFGVGVMANIPQFEQAAFSLRNPGEMSDPFQSAYGWHIVRLERRIAIPPFEQIEETLRKRVNRDDRLRITTDQVRAQQLKSYGFSESEDIKLKLFDQADSSLSKGKWRYRGTDEFLKQRLFTLGDESFHVKAFVRFVEAEQEGSTSLPKDYMRQLYTSFVHAMADAREDRELVAAHPEYRNLVNEYREGILLFTIMEKEVWNRATEDTSGLRLWYEANKTRYAAGERIRARVLASEDSAFMKGMVKKIRAGDSLTRTDIKRFKSIQGPRNFAPGESKAVDVAPKVMGIHKVKVEAMHYLVQVESLVPAGIRSLDEIRSQVISDYQDYLEKEWVKELRNKYSSKVNSKARKSVIRELTQS